MDDVMCGKARKTCSSSRSIISLHDDILVKIFTRLSITTILQCKTLCKSFYTFLSCRYFAESYLLNPPFTNLIIHNGITGEFFSLFQLDDSVYKYDLQSIKSTILPNPFGLSFCGPFTRALVGSCNGFFCFSDKDLVYVTNPLSGAHVSLPQEEALDLSRRSYGFGFCPQTQQYKVVELASYRDGRRPLFRTEVHVFTLGVDKSWRRIQSRFQHIEQRRDMTCPGMKFLVVNGKGALHWIVEGKDRLDYLYSLEMNEEEVVPIPPPVRLTKCNSTTQLVGIHGCLCLLHLNDVLLHTSEYEKSAVEFWCMKDYMDQDSWTLRTISQSCLPKALTCSSFEVAVGAWNNEEVLMIYYDTYLAFCFLETENITVTRMELPPASLGRGATCFVPNFFSYLEAGTTDEKAKDVAATRKLGLLQPTELRNGSARIMENILSKVPLNTIRIAKTYSMPSNTVQLILCDKDSPRLLYELKSDSNNNVKASQLLAATPSSTMAKVTVLGSCNGLLCLSVLNDDHHDDQTQSARRICICNPVLQEVAILPQPQVVKRICDEAYGFGFSSISGHYKVLRILTRKWHPGKLDAYVLTIGIDNKWRKVVVVGGGKFRMPRKWPHDINKAQFCDVTFNNKIHWIGAGDSQFIIYAFDIDEEQFTSIGYLPLYSTTALPSERYLPCLGISRDCLCLCLVLIHAPYAVDLWSMRTYGSMASWTREKISIPGRNRSLKPLRVCLPVTSWRDEEILIWVEDDGGILISYCLKEKRYTEIKIDVSANKETLITIPYEQSCLSLREAFQNGNLRVKKMELPFKIE